MCKMFALHLRLFAYYEEGPSLAGWGAKIVGGRPGDRADQPTSTRNLVGDTGERSPIVCRTARLRLRCRSRWLWDLRLKVSKPLYLVGDPVPRWHLTESSRPSRKVRALGSGASVPQKTLGRRRATDATLVPPSSVSSA